MYCLKTLEIRIRKVSTVSLDIEHKCDLGDQTGHQLLGNSIFSPGRPSSFEERVATALYLKATYQFSLEIDLFTFLNKILK